MQKIQAELKVLFVVPDLAYQRIRPKSELKVCVSARVFEDDAGDQVCTEDFRLVTR